MAEIINNAHGHKLTFSRDLLLIDEAAAVVVAGNIRRSGGMRQFASNDVGRTGQGQPLAG